MATIRYIQSYLEGLVICHAANNQAQIEKIAITHLRTPGGQLILS